jgi:uncharacterized DUF497 family protein
MIYELVIEPDREEHIAQHHVTVEEVQEVVFGAPFVRRARDGRYHLIGQTQAGRYLTVFVGPRGGGVFGLITARDADSAERRRFQTQRRR